MKYKSILCCALVVIICSCNANPCKNTVNVFDNIAELRRLLPYEHSMQWVVFALKIREDGDIYYYMFPHSLARSCGGAGVSDMKMGVHFSSVDDMISYIRNHNQYNIPIWDGGDFVDRDLFNSASIPLKFDAEERNKIKTEIPNWVDS